MERIGHTKVALDSVVEDWGHTHGVNPDGNVICVPCMAALLADIHEMVFKDTARTSNGKLVFTKDTIMVDVTEAN